MLTRGSSTKTTRARVNGRRNATKAVYGESGCVSRDESKNGVEAEARRGGRGICANDSLVCRLAKW